jgi:hypothetical protein
VKSCSYFVSPGRVSGLTEKRFLTQAAVGTRRRFLNIG